ncbi:flavodoxin [Butyrivibrio sp. AE3004]|uniref:flavodoxin n=1 Tax=Butyrivibrio sp. AE3004 TaxID=1506994 RepID=UPI00068BFBBB|nr:flavodoxin [Butyrivibrio sp. AE3004]
MKTLVAYFSWSGNTEKIAKRIVAKTGADMFRIERKVPYSEDYNTCAYREAKEEIEKKIRPEIKTPLPDVGKIRQLDSGIFLSGGTHHRFLYGDFWNPIRTGKEKDLSFCELLYR